MSQLEKTPFPSSEDASGIPAVVNTELDVPEKRFTIETVLKSTKHTFVFAVEGVEASVQIATDDERSLAQELLEVYARHPRW